MLGKWIRHSFFFFEYQMSIRIQLHVCILVAEYLGLCLSNDIYTYIYTQNSFDQIHVYSISYVCMKRGLFDLFHYQEVNVNRYYLHTEFIN